MSTTTLGASSALATGVARPSLLQRIGEQLILGRQAQAERHVKAYLASLTDRQLADLGFAEDEVRALKSKDHGPVAYIV